MFESNLLHQYQCERYRLSPHLQSVHQYFNPGNLVDLQRENSELYITANNNRNLKRTSESAEKVYVLLGDHLKPFLLYSDQKLYLNCVHGANLSRKEAGHPDYALPCSQDDPLSLHATLYNLATQPYVETGLKGWLI
jgi:hypothetical protein